MKSNFYNLETTIDYDKETITMTEDIQGQIMISIMDTKDKAVREALIRLGWSPPK